MGEENENRGNRDHRFGGPWTTAKLEVLRKYLSAYTTALQNQPFAKAYIDAFAGTGYRRNSRDQSAGPLFADWENDRPKNLLDGSARIALRSKPIFDRYIFIEKNEKRTQELRKLSTEFSDQAEKITVLHGDANLEIQNLCQKNWSMRRAVLFLDPYGMQVEWTTISAIANTRAIDLWLLFPLGMAVSRLLARSGEIDPAWRIRLNILLGTDQWYEEFYKVERAPTLFSGIEEHVEKASNETIGRYFVDRLKSVFAGVSSPGVLGILRGVLFIYFALPVATKEPGGQPCALQITF